MKRLAMKCDCPYCVALAEAHGWPLENWFADLQDTPTRLAVFPASRAPDEVWERQLMSVFGVPAHWQVHRHESLINGLHIRNFKFADVLKKYQAAELQVMRHNEYWYGRMTIFRPWYDTILDDYEFKVWTPGDEQAQPLLWEGVLFSCVLSAGSVRYDRIFQGLPSDGSEAPEWPGREGQAAGGKKPGFVRRLGSWLRKGAPAES